MCSKMATTTKAEEKKTVAKAAHAEHHTEKKVASVVKDVKVEPKPVAKADSAKAESKTTAKAEKEAVVETKKAPVKKKYIPYVEKDNAKKSEEAKKLRGEIALKKKWHPVFRGRFGKRNIRRKSIAKWNKWRKPHGIDLDKKLAHGFRPKVGYGSDVSIKGIHPSGYREVMVYNVNDLAKIDIKTQGARISATVGKRKRNAIVTKANEKKIWIFN